MLYVSGFATFVYTSRSKNCGPADLPCVLAFLSVRRCCIGICDWVGYLSCFILAAAYPRLISPHKWLKIKCKISNVFFYVYKKARRI